MEYEAMPMEELFPLLQLQMERGGKAKLLVTGFSMYPTLRHMRDSVELVPLPEALHKGDLILYKRENGRYILHRIVKISGPRLICCGDNQWVLEPIEASQALALVSKLYRKGREISSDNKLYKSIVRFWIWMMPLRRLLICLRMLCGRMLRK